MENTFQNVIDKAQTFPFSQGEQQGLNLLFHLRQLKKLCKIHETVVFRNWTSGPQDSGPWGRRNKQGGPYDCATLLPGESL